MAIMNPPVISFEGKVCQVCSAPAAVKIQDAAQQSDGTAFGWRNVPVGEPEYFCEQHAREPRFSAGFSRP